MNKLQLCAFAIFLTLTGCNPQPQIQAEQISSVKKPRFSVIESGTENGINWRVIRNNYPTNFQTNYEEFLTVSENKSFADVTHNIAIIKLQGELIK